MIIETKVFKKNFYRDLTEEDKTTWLSVYDQLNYLKEVKDRLAKRKALKPIKGLTLAQLYDYRKELVAAKGITLNEEKPVDKIQKKLDTINKRIIKLGGK